MVALPQFLCFVRIFTYCLTVSRQGQEFSPDFSKVLEQSRTKHHHCRQIKRNADALAHIGEEYRNQPVAQSSRDKEGAAEFMMQPRIDAACRGIQ